MFRAQNQLKVQGMTRFSRLSRVAACAAAASVIAALTSCGSLSRRDEAPEPADQAPEASPAKVQELQNTISTLNAKIEELETQLRAAERRPEFRQSFDRPVRPSAGLGVDSSVAAHDPEAGYVNDSAVQAYRQGKVLFDSEKYPEAILAFSAFLERHGKHVFAGSAQYFLAESYYLQGEYAVAEQEFTRAISLYDRSPQITNAYARLADSYAKQGKTDEAERVRLQIRALFPQSPAAARREVTPAANPVASNAPSLPTVTDTLAAPSSLGVPAPTVDAPRAPTAPAPIAPTMRETSPATLDEPPLTAPDVGGSG